MSRPLIFAIACFGIAIFSTMDAVMKAQSIAIGAFSAMLWRSVFGTVLAGGVMLAARDRWPDRHALGLHVLRGSAGAISIVLFFWGLTRVPLAQGVALAFVSPLVAMGLAALLLGERIERMALVGALTAFGGVAIILFGQSRLDLGPGALAGAGAILGAALFYALSNVLLRKQAQQASPTEIGFFTNFVFLGCYLLAVPVLGLRPMAGNEGWLLLAAVMALVSMLVLAWAYARAEASYLASVEYTAFLWAAMLGYLVFGERVSGWTVAGAALIVAGCLIAARRGTIAEAGPEAGL